MTSMTVNVHHNASDSPFAVAVTRGRAESSHPYWELGIGNVCHFVNLVQLRKAQKAISDAVFEAGGPSTQVEKEFRDATLAFFEDPGDFNAMEAVLRATVRLREQAMIPVQQAALAEEPVGAPTWEERPIQAGDHVVITANTIGGYVQGDIVPVIEVVDATRSDICSIRTQNKAGHPLWLTRQEVRPLKPGEHLFNGHIEQPSDEAETVHA